MQVILQKYVNNLGRAGEVVEVKAGYARNYLVPAGMALSATADNKALIESKMDELRAEEDRLFEQARATVDKLQAIDFNFEVNTRDDGKLFGSVGEQDMVAKAAEHGVEIHRKHVHIVNGPIREMGRYDWVVTLFGGIKAELVCYVASLNAEVNAAQEKKMAGEDHSSMTESDDLDASSEDEWDHEEE